MNDGVSLSITKRPVRDVFEYPAVATRIATDSEDPIALRLIEQLPPTVDEDDVGFHARYGRERWSVKERGRIVYRDTVSADDPVTTVFAVAADEGDLDAYLGKPSVTATRVDEEGDTDPDGWTVLESDSLDVDIGGPVEVAADLSDGRVDDHDDDGIVLYGEESERRRWSAKDSTRDESGNGRARETESDAPSTDGEQSNATDGVDDTATTASDETDGDASTEGSAGDRATGRPVVEQLADELRNRDGSDEAVKTVREHVGGSSPRSVEVKLDHCLARLGELDAYVDALEGFIDDEGSARQVIEGFREDLAAVENRLDVVDDRLETVAERQRDLENRLETVETDVGNAATVDDLAAVQTEHADDVANLRADLDDLDARLSGFEDWRSGVAEALSRPQDDPATVATDDN